MLLNAVEKKYSRDKRIFSKFEYFKAEIERARYSSYCKKLISISFSMNIWLKTLIW